MIFLLTQILHSSRSNHPRIAYKWFRMLLRGYSPPGPLKCSTWHQFCFPYAGSPKFWWSLLDASIYQWTTTTTHLRSVDQCLLTLPQSQKVTVLSRLWVPNCGHCLHWTLLISLKRNLRPTCAGMLSFRFIL